MLKAFKKHPRYNSSYLAMGVVFVISYQFNFISSNTFFLVIMSHIITQFCLALDMKAPKNKYELYGAKALITFAFVAIFLICFVERSRVVKLIWGV